MESHMIKKVKPLKDMVIEVVFINGVNKRYDIKPLLERFEVFKELKDIKLFNSVRVDIGGYGIVWNEDIDLSSEEIWNHGIII